MGLTCAELSKRETKLVGMLVTAEKILMDPRHEKYPQGEEWYTKYASFRKWIDELCDVRAELEGFNKPVDRCLMCGSMGRFPSEIYGCYKCFDEVERSQFDALVTDRGYVAIKTPEELFVVTREADTPVPDRYRGSVRLTTSEVMLLAASEPAAREQIVNLKAVFPGARVE